MSAASRESLDRDMRDERMKECAGEMFVVLSALHKLALTLAAEAELPADFPSMKAAASLIAKIEGRT